MDPLLPADLVGSPGANSQAPRKIAEAYGDSPAIESLNATVVVEIPVIKSRISLHFSASAAAAEGEIFNQIKVKAQPFLQL